MVEPARILSDDAVSATPFTAAPASMRISPPLPALLNSFACTVSDEPDFSSTPLPEMSVIFPPVVPEASTVPSTVIFPVSAESEKTRAILARPSGFVMVTSPVRMRKLRSWKKLPPLSAVESALKDGRLPASRRKLPVVPPVSAPPSRVAPVRLNAPCEAVTLICPALPPPVAAATETVPPASRFTSPRSEMSVMVPASGYRVRS